MDGALYNTWRKGQAQKQRNAAQRAARIAQAVPINPEKPTRKRPTKSEVTPNGSFSRER